jgi:hypothetical protein
MLIQERVSGPDMWLKLFVTIDDLLKRVHDGLRPQYLPRDPGGGQPQLSVAEVVTMLVWGAWRGLSEKAKLSYYRCEPPRREFPRTGLVQRGGGLGRQACADSVGALRTRARVSAGGSVILSLR